MSELVVNLNNTVHSDTALYNKVAYFGAYSPRFYRYYYATNVTTTAKDRPLIFDQAGTLKGIAFGFGVYSSHYDNADDIIDVNIYLEEFDGTDWVKRTKATIRNTDYFTLPAKRSIRDLIYAEFDTNYPIDTDPDKWRFRFEVERISGSDARYFYLLSYDDIGFENAGVVIPVLEETETFDESDSALINFGKFVINDSRDFYGHDITSKGWESINYHNGRVLFLNGVTKLGEEHPKIIITENAGTVKLGGIIGISSSNDKEEASLYVCQDEDHLDLPARNKVELIGWQHSSLYRGFFNTYVTGRGYGAYRGISVKSIYDTNEKWRVEVTAPVNKGDSVIKVKGNVESIWQEDDVIYMTSPFYTSNYSYADYTRSEDLIVDTCVYDAGADETTVTLKNTTVYYYDWEIINNTRYPAYDANFDTSTLTTWAINGSRTSSLAVIRADDGDYCHSTTTTNRMYDLLFDGVFSIDGLRMEDYYLLRNDMYSKFATENTFKNNYQKNMIIRNSYYHGVVNRYAKNHVVENYNSILGFIGGTTIRAIRPFDIEYSNGVSIKNMWAMSYGYIYFPYTQNVDIDNITFEGDYFFNVTAGCKIQAKNVTVLKARRMIILGQGAGDISIDGIIAPNLTYHSGYTDAIDNYAGLIYIANDTVTAGKVNISNVLMGSAMEIIHTNAGSSSDVYFKDITITGKVWRQVTTVADKYKQLSAGNIQAFENYNGSGKKEAWTNNGYILATDDGNGGIDWELNPHDSSFTMDYAKNSFSISAGQPISVTAIVKIENEDYYSGTHQLPTLEISGLGMTQSTTISTGVANTEWQPITVTGIPTEDGFFDIKLSFQTNSLENKILLRKIAVYPAKPRDTATLNYTDRAMAQSTIVTELASMSEVWTVPSAIDFGAGSMGEVQKKTDSNAELGFLTN